MSGGYMYGIGMGSGMTGGPAAPPPVNIPTPAIPGPWNDNKGPGLNTLYIECMLNVGIFITEDHQILLFSNYK
jgi:hypothetical protein